MSSRFQSMSSANFLKILKEHFYCPEYSNFRFEPVIEVSLTLPLFFHDLLPFVLQRSYSVSGSCRLGEGLNDRHHCRYHICFHQ